LTRILIPLSATWLAASPGLAKSPNATVDNPASWWRWRSQDVGNIVVDWGNDGMPWFTGGYDQCTGRLLMGVECPKGSHTMFDGFQLWVGGIKGKDTTVTTMWDWVGHGDNFAEVLEFWPAAPPRDEFITQTSRERLAPGGRCAPVDFSRDAISEYDLISMAEDTLHDPRFVEVNPFDGRKHRPVGLQLTTRSYAWSYEYAQDFIIVEYTLKNIGTKPFPSFPDSDRIDGLMLGIHLGGHVINTDPSIDRVWREGGDDIVGRITSTPLLGRPDLPAQMNLVWIADNNGDPANGAFDDYSTTTAFGIVLLAPGMPESTASFNWWTYWPSFLGPGADWGPVRVGSKVDFIGANLGPPQSDREKYQLMTNGEIDYPQVEAALSHEVSGWLPPATGAADIANGAPVWAVLSVGPHELQRGDSITLAFAVVAGEKFHVNPFNYVQRFDAYHPDWYLGGLDFSSLLRNAQWAQRMYDTPGFDTDGDGYRGRYIVDGLDTIYYAGDGVPDLTGPPPPPAPSLSADFQEGTIVLRWNGRKSETTLDPFLNRRDFEGYRVYMSRTGKQDDWQLLAQRDLVNFARYTWSPERARWVLRDPPFTRDSLKALYDSIAQVSYGYPFEPDSFKVALLSKAFLEIVFDPVQPDRVDSFYHYFAPFDANATVDDAGLAAAADARLGVFGKIRKLYPDADTGDVAIRPDGTEFAPYYEYEYAINGLQVAEPVFLVVTAFDHGDPASGLAPLESERSGTSKEIWPINSADIVTAQHPKPGVYPNPYRIVDDYYGFGWENRKGLEPDRERARQVTFYNVPDTCTVSIWSIDGDLVRKLEHRADPYSSEATVVIWDLITRNTQACKTGIYIYSIESRFGTDVGKLVIVK
jgi:hypothetical protein